MCLPDFHTKLSLCLAFIAWCVLVRVGHNVSLSAPYSPHTKRQRKMVMVMARTVDRVMGDVSVSADNGYNNHDVDNGNHSES